jgi:hypothetical protein
LLVENRRAQSAAGPEEILTAGSRRPLNRGEASYGAHPR